MKDLNLSRVGLTMEWRNGTAHSLFAERGPRREVLFQIRDLFPDRPSLNSFVSKHAIIHFQVSFRGFI